MLLIPCPWCGPRDGDRVRLRRRGAHRAAAEYPSARRRGTGPTISSCATNPQGPHHERWLHAQGCRRWFNACATPSPTRSPPSYKWRAAAEGAHGAADRQRGRARDEQPFRLPAGGRIDRGAAARFTFNGSAYQGYRRRHARLGAARQRRARWSRRSFKYHRPRGIVAPASRSRTRWSSSRPARAANPTCARPRSGSTTASSPAASTRWPSVDFDVMSLWRAC